MLACKSIASGTASSRCVLSAVVLVGVSAIGESVHIGAVPPRFSWSFSFSNTRCPVSTVPWSHGLLRFVLTGARVMPISRFSASHAKYSSHSTSLCPSSAVLFPYGQKGSVSTRSQSHAQVQVQCATPLVLALARDGFPTANRACKSRYIRIQVPFHTLCATPLVVARTRDGFPTANRANTSRNTLTQVHGEVQGYCRIHRTHLRCLDRIRYTR